MRYFNNISVGAKFIYFDVTYVKVNSRAAVQLANKKLWEYFRPTTIIKEMDSMTIHNFEEEK